jgi:aminoglycoside/choline kinase family phosphotransferase
MGFPAQPALLTTAWLSSMLRSAGRLTEDQEVRGFSLQPIGHGVGMVGSTQRVELEYDGHGVTAPPSVVTKFAHEVEARRAVGMQLRLYETEVTFYNHIAGSVAVPKPVCHFAAVDQATGESLIVLEDMNRFRQGDSLTGVGPAEARHVIDAVTPLHAAYWNNTGQHDLRNVMRVDSTWKERYTELVEATWQNCVAQFGYCIPAEVQESLGKYIEGFRSLHRVMADRAQTLVHGDPRMDNLMFGEGGEGPSVVLLDWQTLMITNPLHDLAYMLSQSAALEARRAMEDELIRYYHARVTELGVTDYSLEQCYADYDVALLYMMSVALVMGGAFDPANARGRRLAEETLRRACGSVVDRRLLERIPA